jgi:hypothetical protein
MKFPHPIKPHPSPVHPDRVPGSCTYRVTDAVAHRRYLAKDSQWRLHNLARHCARLPNKTARESYVLEVEEKLPALDAGKKKRFMAKFRGVVVWYWRGQRKLQQLQTDKAA